MKFSKVFVHRNPQFAKCPKCNAVSSLHRSRPHNMYEQIIRRGTFLKIYRCKECGWRGFKSTMIFTKRSFRAVFYYIVLIMITAVVARYLILNFVIK